MVDLNSLLITLMYIAGFVLLVVFIIIGIKLIGIQDKVASLNGVFHAVDKFSDNINAFSEAVVSNVVGAISKIFGKKKSIIDEEDDF